MEKTKKKLPQKPKKTEKETILVKKVGQVVSDKNDKTIIVEVVDIKTHPVYGKKYKRTNRYKVHDEKNEHKAGEKVTIVQCRPISKEKTWKVL
jgi:small subunit ribosomal protein S17